MSFERRLLLQDNINMQINNLARDNLQDKYPVLKELVTDEFWPYFANYMVVKRAAQVSTPTLPITQTTVKSCSPRLPQPQKNVFPLIMHGAVYTQST